MPDDAKPDAMSDAARTPPALTLIDIQEGLDDPRLGARNNPSAEQNMARLLTE